MGKKSLRTSFLLLLSLILSFSGLGQTQIVKGTIVDAQADYPLIGVTVTVADSNPIQGAVSDIHGNFKINDIPVGRQTLVVQYIGYKSITIPNVLVNSGKEVIVNVKLEESIQKMESVVITAETDKDIPLNDLAKVSARTFSLEEVLRYSGGRNDVARLTSNFAGVSTPDDSRNDIVVRGNSPTALLWKVEGIPMANVNHFATLSTTGGPVSALNTNLLRTSDFLTGAFPAEYGNANGAVFDINFRNGNSDTYEFTVQIGAFSGMELLAEGPISRANNSSFLVSYRYGIARFAAPGTSAKPIYQDFAFKLNVGDTPLGKLTFFGIGGLSKIDFIGDEIDETDLFANPNEDAFYNGGIGLIGMSQVLRFNKNTFLKNSLGFTINKYNFDQDNYINGSDERRKYRAVEARENSSRYTFSSQLNVKFSARFNLRGGLLVEQYYLGSDVIDRDDRPNSQIPDDDANGVPDFFFQVRDVDEYFWLWQPYVQGEYKFSDEVSLTGGIHIQTLSVNNKTAVEPRLGLSWQFRPTQRLSLAYGLHSQNLPFPIMFLREETSPDVFEEANRDLDFIKSHHFVLGYDIKLGDQWRIKTELYYQDIFKIPIEQSDTSSYSVINEGADFVFDERVSLSNDGTGFNYGAELTLEKFFSNNYYILLTTSLFESKYKGGDGIERNTAFNNNHIVNILVGREWKIGSQKKNLLTFDTKFSTSRGRPYTPVDVQSSMLNNNDQVLFEELAFSERLKPYLRWDVKFGFRLNVKNKKAYHQFFLDLQNVTNRSNEFTRRYNEVTQEVNIVEQIRFFPDILYRYQF